MKVIANLISLIERVKGDEDVLGIGIGCPGPLDARSGTILSPPNLPGWDRIPLASIVEEHFELPVKVENDANVAAVAEAKLGAGAGYESVYYLTVSTGVGGGFVINGKVFQGANGYAGEVGNMIVVPNGRKHPSLNPGALESLASGTAIGAAGESNGIPGGSEAVFNEARNGNEAAQSIIDEAVDYLAMAIANLTHAINPDVFVVGGGVMSARRADSPSVKGKSERVCVSGIERTRPDRPCEAWFQLRGDRGRVHRLVLYERGVKGMETLKADIIIIGGGIGGCTAALAASKRGKKVIMTEETDWIGGQLTSQAVPPDEHQWIEQFGCTGTYREFRNRVREYYRRHYPLKEEARRDERLNPGKGWVSRLCHEPKVALAVLQEMLIPFTSSGRLQILTDYKVTGADVDGNDVRSVTVQHRDGPVKVLQGHYYLDATETGELLPLAGVEYVTGAEAKKDTGELHAPEEARPQDMQSFTYVFAVDYVEGGNFVIEKPEQYEFWKDYRAPFLQHQAVKLVRPRCPYGWFEGICDVPS